MFEVVGADTFIAKEDALCCCKELELCSETDKIGRYVSCLFK
jgi:hypothetical protein